MQALGWGARVRIGREERGNGGWGTEDQVAIGAVEVGVKFRGQWW